MPRMDMAFSCFKSGLNKIRRVMVIAIAMSRRWQALFLITYNSVQFAEPSFSDDLSSSGLLIVSHVSSSSTVDEKHIDGFPLFTSVSFTPMILAFRIEPTVEFNQNGIYFWRNSSNASRRGKSLKKGHRTMAFYFGWLAGWRTKRRVSSWSLYSLLTEMLYIYATREGPESYTSP